MGTLNEFIAYLDDRGAVVHDLEQRLCALQEKYEAYYAELTRVREHELGQLTAEVVARRRELPIDLAALVQQHETAARAQYDESLAALQSNHEKLQQTADEIRQESMDEEKKIRAQNTSMDQEEEVLKVRSAALLDRITEHNRRIKELGSGFGFFANFFRMRSLHAEAAELKEQETDLAARIHTLRRTWESSDQEYHHMEAKLQEAWADYRGKAAAIQTKIDYLCTSKERIVLRSVMEQVLDAQKTTPDVDDGGDIACSRCKTRNPPSNHFCHICAQRLAQDRPDLEGSISEVAELNHHFDRFSEGMQACQEIIGLLRGVASGIEAFRKSVADVLATQQRHSLSTLQLDVPGSSVEYGQTLDQIGAAMQWDYSVHPKVFAKNVKVIMEQHFTEEQIQAYFEAMGEELSKQADSQW